MLHKLHSQIASPYAYIKALVKWLFLACLIGFLGGLVGSLFHIAIDAVTALRSDHNFLLYLLPVGGVILAALYHVCKKYGKMNTDCVFDAVKSESKIPLILAPLIFISTVITHLVGGSAGREGAALQLGGSIGYNIGRLFRLNKKDLHIIVMTGMSAVFAALFGTPLTAAVFALEVVSVGISYYAGLVPCVLSAIVASRIALMCKLHPVHFSTVPAIAINPENLAKIILLALLCALVSIVFCVAVKKGEHYADKLLPNPYLRGAAGGIILIALTLLVGSRDYNGAGMDIITNAMTGSARPEAFLLKLIFTVITIAAGFKGGEIVPVFFIGSTFGCVIGSWLGLSPAFAAAVGFVAVFCGAVNCPIASIILSLEVFGGDNLPLFALVCAVSYMMSGRYGLYQSQRIVYSKIEDTLLQAEE
ncbi:MAG: chloride channel protein [Ruminococcaceae bacterium]|nr:chloride channel protein [Oscillospiraceae bacterium]